MTYKEMEEIRIAEAKVIREMMEKLGCVPITQHPDYEQDVAYDIDDIAELVASLTKEQE